MSCNCSKLLQKWSHHHYSFSISNPNPRQVVAVSVSVSRRSTVLLISSSPFTAALWLSPPPPPAEAIRERRNNKNIPIDSYITTRYLLLSSYSLTFMQLSISNINCSSICLFSSLIPADGLKYYDLKEGKGPVAQKGSTVQVHFECLFRGVTAISSRESKLLAGNRSIAQPYEFTVGGEPGKERKRDFVDNPNGLFSAQASPKPPPAMYSIVEGMRVGGKRTVIVPPEKGYGQRGMNEIPPGATFELNVELLEVVAT